MGTITAAKNGRSRQSFGGDHGKVLSHGSKVGGSISAPASNDAAGAKLKGKAWSLSKNKTACC